jgi:phosphoribosylaminoimidazole-succinocarboxamide synthase
MDDAVFREQLAHTLTQTNLAGLGQRRQGKVRDTYLQGDRLYIVTTDRISAFDHVLGTVPFKGEILTRTTAFWFEKTRDVVPNHVLEVPDPNVLVARACRPLPVEFVVRGYLTGSLWRDYQAGKGGAAYGLELPRGMRRDERFPVPIITPTTKAEQGQHDEPISPERIVVEGLVPAGLLDRAFDYARALFERGQQWAATRGLILVDTKYEFGLADGELLVIDEIHTMDSSRFWEAAEYQARFERGEEQRMLDKENVRQWLVRERGFSGEGVPPPLTDEVRIDAARIYANAYERLTGEAFPPRVGDVHARIEAALRARGAL